MSDELTFEEQAELIIKEEMPDKWQPPDPTSEGAEKTADWLASKCLNAQQEITRVKVGYKPRLQRAENRLKAFLWKFGPWLQEFTLNRIQGKKIKSVLLDTGKIGFRLKPEKLEIEDEDLLAEWALEQSHPEVMGYIVKTESAQAAADMLVLNEEEDEDFVAPEGLEVVITIPAGYPELANLVSQGIEECVVLPVPDKKAVEKYFKSTGEVPPGVTFSPASDQFYVSEHKK